MAKKDTSSPDDLENFLLDAVGMRSTIFVGIDPGAQGAIGWLCGSLYCVTDIPTIKVLKGKKNRTEFNNLAILEMFRLVGRNVSKERVSVVLEKAPATMGPGRGYADVIINRACAMWPLFIMEKGYRFEEVDPNAWKKKMGLSPDKENSRRKAQARFPEAPLVRVEDHNRAEALLLAEYHKRITLGKL